LTALLGFAARMLVCW